MAVDLMFASSARLISSVANSSTRVVVVGVPKQLASSRLATLAYH